MRDLFQTTNLIGLNHVSSMYSWSIIYEIGTHVVTTFLPLNYPFYLPYPLYNFLEILFNTEIRSDCALHYYNAGGTTGFGICFSYVFKLDWWNWCAKLLYFSLCAVTFSSDVQWLQLSHLMSDWIDSSRVGQLMCLSTIVWNTVFPISMFDRLKRACNLNQKSGTSLFDLFISKQPFISHLNSYNLKLLRILWTNLILVWAPKPFLRAR